MTTHKIIYAWGDFGPDSVTGSWSANTFYDDSAAPYVPLAAIAAAYEDAADNLANYPRIAPDETEAQHYDEQIEHSQSIVLSLTPSDALAALERERRKAKNEALEGAAKRAEGWPYGSEIAADIRAMKEPE